MSKINRERAMTTLREVRDLYDGIMPSFTKPLQDLVRSERDITNHAYNVYARIIRNEMSRDGLNPYIRLTYPEANPR